MGLQKGIGRGEGHDQQENGLGLPGDFALGHASW
jgi:hypothetical protein